MKKLSSTSLLLLPFQFLLPAALSLLFLSSSGEDHLTYQDDAAIVTVKKEAPAPWEGTNSAIAILGGYEELVKALTFVDESLYTQLAVIHTANNQTGAAITNKDLKNDNLINT